MNLEALKAAKKAYLSKSINLNMRHLLGITAAVLAVLLIVAGIAFWIGTQKADEWADSEYLQQSEKRLRAATEAEARARVYLDQAKELALENEKQKTAGEERAEKRSHEDAVLTENRKQSEKTANQNAEQIEKEKVKRHEQIKTDGNDFDAQLNGLCRELARSGSKPLSICPGPANNP